MRLAAITVGLVAALSGLVVSAASADTLRVTGDRVNVRAGPDLSAAVLLQVHSDQEVVGLDRDDRWVRVRLSDRDLEGWIHGSLLTPADETVPGQGDSALGAPSTPHEIADNGSDTGPDVGAGRYGIQTAAAPVDHVALDRFRGSVDYINQRATRMAGASFSPRSKPLGPARSGSWPRTSGRRSRREGARATSTSSTCAGPRSLRAADRCASRWSTSAARC